MAGLQKNRGGCLTGADKVNKGNPLLRARFPIRLITRRLKPKYRWLSIDSGEKYISMRLDSYQQAPLTAVSMFSQQPRGSSRFRPTTTWCPLLTS